MAKKPKIAPVLELPAIIQQLKTIGPILVASDSERVPVANDDPNDSFFDFNGPEFWDFDEYASLWDFFEKESFALKEDSDRAFGFNDMNVWEIKSIIDDLASGEATFSVSNYDTCGYFCVRMK